MPLINFINELKQEAAVTRRFLAVVPFDQADFKPHPNSESLGKLAIHVAEIIAWWKSVLTNHELDFEHFEPQEITSTDRLLAFFDELLSQAIEALQNSSEDTLEGTWSMRNGTEVYFTLSKSQALRIFCMNHLVHHRAQLGVYLRLLNVPVPATYGPSADDFEVILVDRWA
jgi:uncharacterized damage-inducible protein DinB